jgi:hypothetical protein
MRFLLHDCLANSTRALRANWASRSLSLADAGRQWITAPNNYASCASVCPPPPAMVCLSTLPIAKAGARAGSRRLGFLLHRPLRERVPSYAGLDRAETCEAPPLMTVQYQKFRPLSKAFQPRSRTNAYPSPSLRGCRRFTQKCLGLLYMRRLPASCCRSVMAIQLTGD